VATKLKLSVMERSILPRDFEALLRRAAKCQKTQRPYLLKKTLVRTSA
jgi:hypothetical protein